MSESTFIRLIVGLLLSATGIHASCPIELSPPSVVVRYGSSVSVNCSASRDVEGIGWEVDGGTGLMLNISFLSWTVERLTDWTIRPHCFIEIPDIGQCSTILSVVLYKIPDNITLHLVDAPDGPMNENEEYTFACDVQDVAPVRHLIVTWYKGNETEVKTERFGDNPSRTPVTQISVFHFAPSQDDNGARLRCEARLDLGPEGPQHPIISQEYPLTVHFGPDINCSRIEIYEGESLEGQCAVTGNPSPNISWSKDGQPVDPTVPLSRKNAGQYTIEAEGHNNARKNILVFVLYEPELDCPNSYRVAEYAAHHLTCTVAGYPPPVVIWHKEGEDVHLPETLTRSDAGQYVITATNILSNISNTVEIDVLYPPLEIFELEDTEVEVGSYVGLKCSSTANPRPKYLWSYHKAGNDREENEDGVSLLHIHNTTGDNTGNYTCYAWNEQGNISKTARVTVKGAKAECPVQITPERMVVEYGDPVGSAHCQATSMSSPKEIYWKFPHHVINSSHLSSAHIHPDWDLRPFCIAVFEGMGKCEKPLDFTMYRIPERMFIRSVNHNGPMVEGSEYQLRCDIINVAPVQKLTVRWYKGNETIKTDSYSDQTRTPVNVSSTINVTLSRTDDGAEFRCEAQLDLGPEGPLPLPTTVSSPLNITVHYKPIINTTKLPKKIPVFRGYPGELVCEAEGHPPPWIQWTYSTDKKVSRMSGGNLTVYEAGLYTCNATNDVASSSVVVEVVLKEDYLPLIAGFVAVTVVVISVIFVFIYSIYYKNTKIGRYSLKNPKLSTQNGNVAHNGWDMQLPMTKLS